MRSRIVSILTLVMCVSALGTEAGFAQAVFSVGSSPLVAADIGYAELAGTISLTVFSGTTVAAPVEITYPTAITNNSLLEISVSGLGGFSGASFNPVLDKTTNSITISVPSGGASGDRILISGVRLAIAGSNLTQVTAAVSGPGNSVVTGQNHPIVISAVEQPFSVTEIGGPLSSSSGIVSIATMSLLIKENYLSAFTGLTGVGGQTVPTNIQITPFPQIPTGMQITFASVATSPESGATLATVSGVDETVPRTDGSTGVIFQYTPSANRSSVLESFPINIAITADTGASGEVQFQAALIPIGAAQPNQQYPSTDIPRYAQRLVPDALDLVTGATELYFPFVIEAQNTYTGVALTNPHDYPVRTVLTAFDANGNAIAGDGIQNPVVIVVPANGQYAELASEIFGTGFNSTSPGMIQISSNTASLEGFYTLGDLAGPKLDGGSGNIDGSGYLYIPVIAYPGPGPYNSLEIYNPGQSAANLALDILDAAGQELTGTKNIAVPAGSLVMQDASDIFGIDLSSMQGVYVQAVSDSPVILRNNFGNALESNILAAQNPSSVNLLEIPHFAAGGGYTTDLAVINAGTGGTLSLALTLLGDDGSPLAVSGNPASVQIAPGAELAQSIDALFPSLGSALVTGSIQVSVAPSYMGPFLMTPGLVGAVRIGATNGSASSTFPMVLRTAMDCIYSQVAQADNFYTGLVVLNGATQPADVSVGVYEADGELVGSFSTTLAPGQRLSKLVSELVPASAGQTGGYLRLTSDVSVTSLAMFGTTDMSSLSLITPQILK